MVCQPCNSSSATSGTCALSAANGKHRTQKASMRTTVLKVCSNSGFRFGFERAGAYYSGPSNASCTGALQPKNLMTLLLKSKLLWLLTTGCWTLCWTVGAAAAVSPVGGGCCWRGGGHRCWRRGTRARCGGAPGRRLRPRGAGGGPPAVVRCGCRWWTPAPGGCLCCTRLD